jgi:pimeloyl-ACP methyl ester carboxylesterase
MGYPKTRKGYYDTPEGQVHYRYLPAAIKDDTKAPIMLLHMSACSSFYYKEMIQRLSSDGHDVYSPDMPGYAPQI